MKDNFSAQASLYQQFRPTYPQALYDYLLSLVQGRGQAAHWFQLEQFYQEVNRVGKQGGIIALWGYGLLSIDPALDPLLQYFYTQVVGPYWDPERQLVDQAYSTIPFPFHEEPAFSGFIEVEWQLQDLEGYLNTWSSVQAYLKEHPQNPVTLFMPQIQAVWPEGQKKTVRFPIFSRIGRIQK